MVPVPDEPQITVTVLLVEEPEIVPPDTDHEYVCPLTLAVVYMAVSFGQTEFFPETDGVGGVIVKLTVLVPGFPWLQASWKAPELVEIVYVPPS